MWQLETILGHLLEGKVHVWWTISPALSNGPFLQMWSQSQILIGLWLEHFFFSVTILPTTLNVLRTTWRDSYTVVIPLKYWIDKAQENTLFAEMMKIMWVSEWIHRQRQTDPNDRLMLLMLWPPAEYWCYSIIIRTGIVTCC